jgi:hypothetical protein
VAAADVAAFLTRLGTAHAKGQVAALLLVAQLALIALTQVLLPGLFDVLSGVFLGLWFGPPFVTVALLLSRKALPPRLWWSLAAFLCALLLCAVFLLHALHAMFLAIRTEGLVP